MIRLALFALGPRVARADSGTQATGLAASYALESSQDYAGALKALDAVVGEVPAYVITLRRGWLEYLQGDTTASIAAYDQAIEAAPAAIEPRIGRTLPLMAARRWSDVEAACRDVLHRAPGEPTAQARLAWALFNEGRYHDATAAYRTALTAWPSDPDLTAGLAWSLCRDGHRPQSLPLFRQALALDPTNTPATTGLTTCGGAGVRH